MKSLHADLTVVGQHQEDLAEGVSYLGGALKGFQSIAYSGSTPVQWGNIFVNPASLTNTFGVIGPCGVLDQVLTRRSVPTRDLVCRPDRAAAGRRVEHQFGPGSSSVVGRTCTTATTSTPTVVELAHPAAAT